MAGRKHKVDDHNSKLTILTAAIAVFARDGYHGASVRDISRECGIKQPTIYHFFESKENLYRASLRAAHLLTLRVIKRELSITKSLETDIISFFTAVKRRHDENPERLIFLFRLVYASPNQIRHEYLSRYAPDFAAIIRRIFRRHRYIKGLKVKMRLVMHIFQSFAMALSHTDSRDLAKDVYISFKDEIRFILRH